MSNAGQTPDSETPAPSRGDAFPWYLIVVQLTLLAALPAIALWGVPLVLRYMANYGIDLPHASIVVLKIIHFFRARPEFAWMLLGLTAATDAAIVLTGGRDGSNRPWWRVWFVALPLALIAVIVLALAVPIARLLWQIYL